MTLRWLGQQAEVPKSSALPMALAIGGIALVLFFATLRTVERR